MLSAKKSRMVASVGGAVLLSGCAMFCGICKETQLTIKMNEPLVAVPTVAVRDVVHKSEVAKVDGTHEHVICIHKACGEDQRQGKMQGIWLHFLNDEFSGDVLQIKKASENLGKTIVDENGYTVSESGIIGAQHFDFNKADLIGDLSGLSQVVRRAKECKTCKINIEGHTDAVGGAKYNVALSIRRANAVKNWLIKEGVPAKLISVKGLGKTKPIADNSTEEGRAKNRRAEYKVLIKVEENK